MPIRRSVLIVLLTTLTTAAATQQSWAGGMPAPDLPDAQEIVDACWAVSKDDREGKTLPRIRDGHAKTHRCLEQKILDLRESLRFSDFELNREKMAKELANLREAAGALYRMIYYDNAFCAPRCRPNDPTAGEIRYTAMLERIIREMVWMTGLRTGQADPSSGPPIPFIRAEDRPADARLDAGSSKSYEMVDACWAISLKDRSSPNTPRQREGHINTVFCLEGRVAELRRTLGFGGTTLSEEETYTALYKVRLALGRIYWMIGNDSEYCGGHCGTMWFIFHLPRTGSAFAELIHVMTDQAKAYRGNSLKSPAQ